MEDIYEMNNKAVVFSGGHLEDICRTFGGHLLNFGSSGPANVFGASPKNLEDIYTNIFFSIVTVTQTDYPA